MWDFRPACRPKNSNQLLALIPVAVLVIDLHRADREGRAALVFKFTARDENFSAVQIEWRSGSLALTLLRENSC
jgi:hypothetical protein